MSVDQLTGLSLRRRDLEASQEAEKRLQQKIDDLENQMAGTVPKGDAQKTLDDLLATRKELEVALQGLRSAKADNVDLKDEAEKLRAERVELIARLGDMVPKRDFDTVQEELKNARDKIKELEKLVAMLKEGSAESEAALTAAAAQMERLRSHLASAVAEVEAQKIEVETLRKQSEHARSYAQAMLEKAKGMEAENQSLGEWLKNKEAAVKEALEEIERLKGINSGLVGHDTIEDMKEKVLGLQRELQGVIQELREAQKALDEERREKARLKARYGITTVAAPEKSTTELHLGFITVTASTSRMT